jgi:hypothetical protein
LGERDGRNLDVQVDPVQQGAGDLAQVLLDLRRRAATGAPRVGTIAARAGFIAATRMNSAGNIVPATPG